MFFQKRTQKQLRNSLTQLMEVFDWSKPLTDDVWKLEGLNSLVFGFGVVL
jgi:hypothetical protein